MLKQACEPDYNVLPNVGAVATMFLETPGIPKPKSRSDKLRGSASMCRCTSRRSPCRTCGCNTGPSAALDPETPRMRKTFRSCQNSGSLARNGGASAVDSRPHHAIPGPLTTKHSHPQALPAISRSVHTQRILAEP